MKIVKKLIVAIAVSTSILGVTVVKAQQRPNAEVSFQGKGYRVVVLEVNGSLNYRGCDDKKQCVSLKGGQAWDDGDKQGIVWEGPDGRYELSWAVSDPNNVSIVAYKGDQQTMQYNLTRTGAK